MATELAIAGRVEAPMRRTAETAVDPFEPQDWQGLLSLAKMVSATDFAPKDFKGKPEACAIAMMYGKQLGIGALQAIQGIAVINGRPSVWGDTFWAIILSHPELEDVQEHEGDTKATVTLKRRGRTARTVEFTVEDAKKAGLLGKQGPWSQYPKTMMLWRARSIAGRAVFADALKGITSNYEAEDAGPIIDAAPAATTAVTAETTTPTALPAAKITEDQAREFGKAWKASGYAMPEAKAALKRICGVEASLDIPADKYVDAMRWANTPKGQPESSPDEKLCREMFGILEYDLAKQAQAIADAEGDWKALAMKLSEELPEEK